MSVIPKKVSKDDQLEMNQITARIRKLVKKLKAEAYTGELSKDGKFSGKIRWATPVITAQALPEVEDD
jgi:hypothetical protein